MLNSANQKINVPRGVSSGVNPQPDPLSQLEVSVSATRNRFQTKIHHNLFYLPTQPAKSLRKDSDSLLEFEGLLLNSNNIRDRSYR